MTINNKTVINPQVGDTKLLINMTVSMLHRIGATDEDDLNMIYSIIMDMVIDLWDIDTDNPQHNAFEEYKTAQIYAGAMAIFQS